MCPPTIFVLALLETSLAHNYVLVQLDVPRTHATRAVSLSLSRTQFAYYMCVLALLKTSLSLSLSLSLSHTGTTRALSHSLPRTHVPLEVFLSLSRTHY